MACGIALITYGCLNIKQQTKVDYSLFSDFEILEPDYSHVDTLVVLNSSHLCEAWAKYQPASDGEISELLGKYTLAMNDTLRQAYKTATIKEGNKKFIDMAILNDEMKNLVIDYYLE